MIRTAIVCLLMIAGVVAHAQQKPSVIEYINTYKALAISEMQRTGIPAAIKLAQGIHETDAGNSELVRKSNNHFGIKCKSSWTGGKVYHDDDARGECFRSYEGAQDSYVDHSNFLKNNARYSFLFDLEPTDFEGWAYGLKKAGYATNVKYSQILIKIINEYHLQEYTLIALGKMNPGDEWLAKMGAPAPLPEEIKIETTAGPAEKVTEEPETIYPEGEFKINNTRVVYAKAGTALLVVAEQYDVPLKRLMDFNDLSEENTLARGQLIFLQRKRKIGQQDFHVVQNGETIYDICQFEGIRLENLLEYNHLVKGMQPAEGEKLYLKDHAPARPLLASEVKKQEPVMSYVKNVSMETNLSSTTHRVQVKETLFSISKKYGVSIEKLMQWNNLASYDLRTGQELIIYKN